MKAYTYVFYWDIYGEVRYATVVSSVYLDGVKIYDTVLLFELIYDNRELNLWT